MAQYAGYYYTDIKYLKGDVMKSSTAAKAAPSHKDIMHGAAIIDEKGKETPITEEMIQKALKKILQATKS